jgi:type IV secretory pathway TrbL component
MSRTISSTVRGGGSFAGGAPASGVVTEAAGPATARVAHVTVAAAARAAASAAGSTLRQGRDEDGRARAIMVAKWSDGGGPCVKDGFW